MRKLTYAEQSQVGGGVLNLAAGAIGAGIGGVVPGANYAIQTDDFSWGGFIHTASTAPTAGFLIGTGVSLLAGAAAGGVLQGSTVLGITFIGTGSAIGATAPMVLDSGPGERKTGGS